MNIEPESTEKCAEIPGLTLFRYTDIGTNKGLCSLWASELAIGFGVLSLNTNGYWCVALVTELDVCNSVVLVERLKTQD